MSMKCTVKSEDAKAAQKDYPKDSDILVISSSSDKQLSWGLKTWIPEKWTSLSEGIFTTSLIDEFENVAWAKSWSELVTFTANYVDRALREKGFEKNKQTLTVSASSKYDLDAKWNLVKGSGTCRALFIAPSYEGKKESLGDFRRNADAVKAFLERHLSNKYVPANVRYMNEDVDPKSADYPSKQNILAALEKIAKDSKPGDNIFFYYSGHGSYSYDIQSKNRDEESDGKNIADQRDEAILPSDFDVNPGPAGIKLITDDELHAQFIKKIKGDVHTVCIFDSCYSGTIMDLPYNWEWKTDF